jgi:hypothetical protein
MFRNLIPLPISRNLFAHYAAGATMILTMCFNPWPTNVIYIYMELLVMAEILTSCIHGLTFGNAESRLFLFVAQCFNTESVQKVALWHSCV